MKSVFIAMLCLFLTSASFSEDEVIVNADRNVIPLELSEKEIKNINEVIEYCQNKAKDSAKCFSHYLQRLKHSIELHTGGTRTDQTEKLMSILRRIFFNPRSSVSDIPMSILDIDLAGTGKTWYGKIIKKFLGLEEGETFISHTIGTNSHLRDDVFPLSRISEKLQAGEFVVLQLDEIQNLSKIVDGVYEKIGRVNKFLLERGMDLSFDPNDMNFPSVLENLKYEGEGENVVQNIPNWSQADVKQYKEVMEASQLIWSLLGDGRLEQAEVHYSDLLNQLSDEVNQFLQYEEAVKKQETRLEEEKLKLETLEVDVRKSLEDKKDLTEEAILEAIEDKKTGINNYIDQYEHKLDQYKRGVRNSWTQLNKSKAPERFMSAMTGLKIKDSSFVERFFQDYLEFIKEENLDVYKGICKDVNHTELEASAYKLWQAYLVSPKEFSDFFTAQFVKQPRDGGFKANSILDTRRVLFIFNGNDPAFYDQFIKTAISEGVTNHEDMSAFYRGYADTVQRAKRDFIDQTFGNFFKTMISGREDNIGALLDRLKAGGETQIHRSPRTRAQWHSYIRGIVNLIIRDYTDQMIENDFLDNEEYVDRILDYLRNKYDLRIEKESIDREFMKIFVANEFFHANDELIESLTNKLTTPFEISRGVTDSIKATINESVIEEITKYLGAPDNETKPLLSELLDGGGSDRIVLGEREITIDVERQLGNDPIVKRGDHALSVSWVRNGRKHTIFSPLVLKKQTKVERVSDRTTNKVTKLFNSLDQVKTHFIYSCYREFGVIPNRIDSSVDNINGLIHEIHPHETSELTMKQQVARIRLKISVLLSITDAEKIHNDQKLALDYSQQILEEIEILLQRHKKYMDELTKRTGVSELAYRGQDKELMEMIDGFYKEANGSTQEVKKMFFQHFYSKVSTEVSTDKEFIDDLHQVIKESKQQYAPSASGREIYFDSTDVKFQLELEMRRNLRANINYYDEGNVNLYEAFTPNFEKIKDFYKSLDRALKPGDRAASVLLSSYVHFFGQVPEELPTSLNSYFSSTVPSEGASTLYSAQVLDDEVKQVKIKLMLALDDPKNAGKYYEEAQEHLVDIAVRLKEFVEENGTHHLSENLKQLHVYTKNEANILNGVNRALSGHETEVKEFLKKNSSLIDRLSHLRTNTGIRELRRGARNFFSNIARSFAIRVRLMEDVDQVDNVEKLMERLKRDIAKNGGDNLVHADPKLVNTFVPENAISFIEQAPKTSTAASSKKCIDLLRAIVL